MRSLPSAGTVVILQGFVVTAVALCERGAHTRKWCALQLEEKIRSGIREVEHAVSNLEADLAFEESQGRNQR